MTSTHTSLAGLNGALVGVVGAGATGLAVLAALAELGARAHVLDSRPEAIEDLGAPVVAATAGDDQAQAEALVQTHPDLVIVSPGVPATGPVMAAASAAGLEVWSEIELAWRLQQDLDPRVPWLTLTGTDGKTTTVGMLSAILSAAGLSAPAAGNIGVPTVTTVMTGGSQALAVELSSFQLHTTHSVSPLAAACLNLAPDHLDWHGGYDAYGADKARVYTGAQRAAVYNAADPATLRMLEEADVAEGCRAIGFTLGVPGLGQLGLVGDVLVDRAHHPRRQNEGLELATLADLAQLAPGGQVDRLPAHIVADALAAAAQALSHQAVAADPTAVARGLRGFAPGAHRLVTVAQAGGVTWVNDSKATNPHAAEAAISSLPAGTCVWIVGGDTKGAAFHELVATVRPALRGVVVIGKDQTAILDALAGQAPDLPVTRVADGAPEAVTAAAVVAAAAMARPGDTVMLAPACASWDQFSSYAQRGDLFAEAAAAHTSSHDVTEQAAGQVT